MGFVRFVNINNTDEFKRLGRISLYENEGEQRDFDNYSLSSSIFNNSEIVAYHFFELPGFGPDDFRYFKKKLEQQNFCP